MKILFWVPYPKEGPSNRYRVEQYLPYLKSAGIEYTLHSFWGSSAYRILYRKGHIFKKVLSFLCGVASRIADLALIRMYDMVFIHREAMPIGGALLESILFRIKKPVIFDFDDAIFLPSSSRHNDFIEKFKNPNKIADIIKGSSFIIAGNRYLAEFAHCYNQNVSVIPTPVDTKRYSPAKKDAAKKSVTIGWIGSSTTADFLYPLKDVFREITKLSPEVDIEVIGGNIDAAGIPNVIYRPWSIDSEIKDLNRFDIGIMPMPDNAWTRGKCGFKAILYMSLGIPCVSSPVGVNKEIIADGINGFLAETREEWIEKLSLLIKDANLRERIGSSGRKTILEKYSLQVNAPKFLEVIKRIVK